MPTANQDRRNPGPPFGYQLLRLLDRCLPESIYRPLRAAGTAVAVPLLPSRRRASREYLTAAFGRPARLRDVWRHFFALEESLLLRLRVANGRPHRCDWGPGSDDFRAWTSSGGPALLGTMHIGDSDLLGFRLPTLTRTPVTLVRHRVGNAHDTDALARRFADAGLRIAWVNNPEDLLFGLRDVLAAGGAVALQCDRTDFASRTGTFDFLGGPRRFPVTIYHLSALFGHPVLHSVGLRDGPGLTRLHAAPAFSPLPGETRASVLARGHDHFQAWLHSLESVLRASPFEWFNFEPLRPGS